MIMHDVDNNVEVLKNHRRELIYRAKHRGIKEMDIILGQFVDHYISKFNKIELKEFEKLLNMQDLELYDWLCNRIPVPEDEYTSVYKLLEKDFKFLKK